LSINYELIIDFFKIFIVKAINILKQVPAPERFKISSFKEKINQFENPNKICFNFVKE
jgi:hypothetical protein